MSIDHGIEEQIEALAQRSHAGALGFGDYVAQLAELGVESYHVDYRRGRSTFHLPSGDTCEIALHLPIGVIAEAWNADHVHEAVRGAQRGEIVYPRFVELTRADAPPLRSARTAMWTHR